MLYLFGVELEKNSGAKRNCWRWSDALDEICPEVAVLIYGFGILQNILSIRVYYCCIFWLVEIFKVALN